MSGITNPAEEYFKDGIWGWDPAAKVWLKLIVDPLTDRLVVDHPGSITVEQAIPGNLTPGIHGWDGTVWRKLPMVWGFSATYSEVQAGIDVPAGNYVILFSQVPAGQIWVVTSFVAYCDQALASGLEVGAIISGTILTLDYVVPTAGPETVKFSGHVILAEDDRLRAAFYACAPGNDVHAYVCGYKMKVAE